MKPIVIPKRVTIPGGLFFNKVGGSFQEGDSAKTSFYIEGNVDIKELAGQSRLFFQNVKLVKRRVVFNDNDKLQFVEKYRVERGVDVNADGELIVDDDDDKIRQLQEEVLAFEAFAKSEQVCLLVPFKQMICCSCNCGMCFSCGRLLDYCVIRLQ